ncbi:hypothetical protein BC831DRAFT_468026 [Entophlyctis helioformis]|nr:hypothetical protein BC831DRAFT_468026 [Entophlyctis helioformis]
MKSDPSAAAGGMTGLSSPRLSTHRSSTSTSTSANAGTGTGVRRPSSQLPTSAAPSPAMPPSQRPSLAPRMSIINDLAMARNRGTRQSIIGGGGYARASFIHGLPAGHPANPAHGAFHAHGKRGSVGDPSMAGAGTIDDEVIRIFLEEHGVTKEDVDNAFEIVSRDGQRIGGNDVRAFVDKYFGGTDALPEKAAKMVKEWKEDITKDQLCQLLLNRTMLSTPWDDAFDWFQPVNNSLGRPELQQLARRINKHKMAGKRDVQLLLAKYDRDRDGQIGLEDFKRMSL